MTSRDQLGDKLSALELLAEITAIVREDVGLGDLLADTVATAITNGLRRRMGGQERYIPAEDKRARNEQIRAEFNGRNRDEILKKYNISKPRLYQIVNK